jgi:hypothetical protein
VNKIKKIIKENSKLVLGVFIGVLIMTAGLAVAAGIGTSSKSKKSITQQENLSNTDKKEAENTKQEKSDSGQTQSGGSSANGGASSSSSNTPNSAPAPTPTPSTPSSVNYSFFAGTYTPQAFPNYPNGGYTGSGNISGTLNAQGYTNLRLSWNKTADLQLRVQGSNNGSSWSDFYTYNTSSGSVTVPVNAAYYRVFAYIGNCLGGSPCEGAELNTPYNLNFSGLLTK